MPLRVLIVDDSPVMRRVVRRTLELSGHAFDKVFECANGLEALELLNANWVDLVLTDVHMPGLSGDELIRRMRADPVLADVPVVVISSDRADERVERLTQLGARAYLKKPFRPEQLGSILASLTTPGVPDAAATL